MAPHATSVIVVLMLLATGTAAAQSPANAVVPPEGTVVHRDLRRYRAATRDIVSTCTCREPVRLRFRWSSLYMAEAGRQTTRTITPT